MRWKVDRYRAEDAASWHPKFIWKPVIYDNHKYWLCFLMRRATNVDGLTSAEVKELIKSDKVIWEYDRPCYYY